MMRPSFKPQGGFSLVELIVVIVLIGIIGGVFAMQVLPAIRAYLVVGQRAALTHQADTALRRIVGDVRRAVPNSLRVDGPQCLELVPSSDGGRYRNEQNYAAGALAADYLDDARPSAAFHVLTRFTKLPAIGDAIVIGNQDPDDVYNGRNVGLVKGVAASVDESMGKHRVTLTAGLQAPSGYTGARFMVVPGAELTVAYRCEGGTLYRIAYPNLQPASRCTTPLPAAAPVVATGVTRCNFTYSANQGATQESGFVQLELTLTGKGESVPLTIGAHVDNVP